MAKKTVVLTRDPYTKVYSNDKGDSTLVAITFDTKDGLKKASCFMSEDPLWKEDTEVELDFYNSDKKDKKGVPYINFHDPNKEEKKVDEPDW